MNIATFHLPRILKNRTLARVAASVALGALAALTAPTWTQAADAGASSAAPPSATPAPSGQKVYGTPEDAVADLVSATRGHQLSALVAILGPGSASVVSSGDAVADKAERERFIRSYDEARAIERDGDARAVLVVGKHGWPFPIALVKSGTGWSFDIKSGREEILNRRIGYNELSAIQAVQAYVDAQLEYYMLNPQQLKSPAFAQRIVSSPGKRDGLYFATRGGEAESPLGPLYDVAPGPKTSAAAKTEPYFGYHYRVLKAQGPDAPGGARDYVVKGRMIAGHALVAWPANYGNSGVMTFIVSHEGVVYENDLGPHTDGVARKMVRFNPDASWKRVEMK